ESGEAILILGIIITMMVADFAYVGAAQVLYAKHWANVCASGGDLCGSVTTVAAHLGEMPAGVTELAYSPLPPPGGSFMAQLFAGVDPATLVILAHVGFWTHATLVMVFLNLLPLSKHFHVITAVGNVYF